MADSEGMFSRGWRDTRATFHDWRFWAVEVIGGGLAGIINPWFALIFIVGCVLVLYIGFTARAPVKLREERIHGLERTFSPATVEVAVLEPPTAKHLSPGGGGKRMVTFPCVSVRTTGGQPEEVSFRLYLEGWDACWVPAFEPPGIFTSPDEPPNFPRLVALQAGEAVRRQLQFRVPFSTEGFRKMRCRLVAVKPAAERTIDTFDFKPTEQIGSRLTVTAALHHLSHAYPPEFTHLQFAAALAKREYVTLTVRNGTTKNFKGVVARCSLAEKDIELPCYWSTKPGTTFHPGEAYSVDLPVGHERVLLVALVFGEDRTWARLPAEAFHVFHSVAITGAGKRLSYGGERLDLGGEARLLVSFKAAGLDQVELIRLGFDATGPAVEQLTPR